MNIESPKVNSLYNKLNAGESTALKEFWNEIKTKGTPMIEEIPGDDNNVILTFIHKDKGHTKNVLVYGSFPGYELSENYLENLPVLIYGIKPIRLEMI